MPTPKPIRDIGMRRHATNVDVGRSNNSFSIPKTALCADYDNLYERIGR
jgi:hypothetical protein